MQSAAVGRGRGVVDLRTGRRIVCLVGVLRVGIGGGRSPQIVGFLLRRRPKATGPVYECRGRGGWARREAPQEGDRAPPPHSLPTLVFTLYGDEFPGEVETVIEEGLIRSRQRVGEILVDLALGKRRRSIEIGLDIGAAALDEMASELATLCLVGGAGEILR